MNVQTFVNFLCEICYHQGHLCWPDFAAALEDSQRASASQTLAGLYADIAWASGDRDSWEAHGSPLDIDQARHEVWKPVHCGDQAQAD